MQLKVSIVTVCYNAGSGLQRTLQAIAAQTYACKEIIVVDGGSTDGSLDSINTWPIDCLVSEPDKGIYDAMNKGLTLATGDYVWFMNAGDLPADPDVLSGLIGAASFLPDVIYGNTQTVHPDRRVKEIVIPPVPLKQRYFAADMVVNHQSVLVKTAICPKFDTQFRIIGDQKWLYELFKDDRSQCYVNRVICRYELGGVSGTSYKRLNNEKIRFIIQDVQLRHKLIALGKVLAFGYVWQALRRVKRALA